jgi:hypothetical protein
VPNGWCVTQRWGPPNYRNTTIWTSKARAVRRPIRITEGWVERAIGTRRSERPLCARSGRTAAPGEAPTADIC